MQDAARCRLILLHLDADAPAGAAFAAASRCRFALCAVWASTQVRLILCASSSYPRPPGALTRSLDTRQRGGTTAARALRVEPPPRDRATALRGIDQFERTLPPPCRRRRGVGCRHRCGHGCCAGRRRGSGDQRGRCRLRRQRGRTGSCGRAEGGDGIGGRGSGWCRGTGRASGH